MIVSIMQPAYLPWSGYFDRLIRSDVNIVLDHVQIDKSSKTKFANRNRVRTKDGWCWLTVPLKTKGKYKESYLNQLEIANDFPWAKEHWNSLRMNYARTSHFATHAPFFEGLYNTQWERLVELTHAATKYLLSALNIQTQLLYSSEMKVEGQKDELILNLCREVDADTYISGPLGRDYLREPLFQQAGICVLYHDYKHPTYPQIFPGFEPYMSVIDLLFNCGPQSRDVLTSAQELNHT